MKDPSKPFPSNDQNLGILRWKSTLKSSNADETSGLLPLLFTTWVNNNNDGTIGLTFEYECDTSKNVNEVVIIIPIINASLESCEDGNASLQFTDDGINVTLTDLLSHQSGSFEILCKDTDDEEALFPMEIVFSESKKIDTSEIEELPVKVEAVVSVESQELLPYDIYLNSTNESYYIV